MKAPITITKTENARNSQLRSWRRADGSGGRSVFRRRNRRRAKWIPSSRESEPLANCCFLSQPEQPPGVLLHDQRPDLVADRDLLEVGHPPVRRQQRVVGPEQHLVLQQRVRVLNQVRREILRRPAGQIDVDLRLVQADGDRLVLPRETTDAPARSACRGNPPPRRRSASGCRTSAECRRRRASRCRCRCGRCETAPAASPRRTLRSSGYAMRSSGKNSWIGGCSFNPRTTPASTRRRASRTASAPRFGFRLANGMAMSGFACANSTTASFESRGIPESVSSTVKMTQAMLRDR